MNTDGQVETGIEAPVEATAEKMLSQEQVNNIAAKARKEAQERAQREIAQLQSEIASLKANGNPVTQEQAQMPQGMDEIYSQVEQRLANRIQEHQVKQAEAAREAEIKAQVDNYLSKMAQGSEMFEDFDEVMKDFNPGDFPNAALLAAEQENTAQIMYELAQHPLKLAGLEILASKNVNQAKRELQKLAASIERNEQAQDAYVPARPPLSAPKPSRASSAGEPSLSDFKNASWARG